MIAALLQGVVQPAVADDTGKGRPDLPSAEKPVPGTIAKAKPRTVMKGPPTPQAAPRATWPKAASTLVTLPAAGAKAGASLVRAQGLPLALAAAADTRRGAEAAPDHVAVSVVGRKAAHNAGVDGLLFTLQPKADDEKAKQAGPRQVRARVDYSSFAEAYGGNYASRLTLVELPACVLTTPDRQQCRTPKPVETVNDAEQQTLTSSELALRADEPTVLAAVAEEGGEKGDYKATSLSPSAAWN
ncbi:sugar-binding protein, partial [Streptomyces rubiginosohelvolus]